MCGIAGVLRIYEPGEPVPPHHESIPESWLDTLDDSIKHRGPDGAGRFRDRATRPDGTTVDVALVHRRLSIIDHAGGAQPMVHVRHPDGTGELLRPSPPSGTGFQPVSPFPPASRGTGVPSVSPPPTLDATSLPPDTDLVAVAFNGCIYNHRELRKDLVAAGHRFVTDHADTEVLIHGWRALGTDLQFNLDGMYALLIWDRATGRLTWGRDVSGEKPLYLDSHPGLLAWSSSDAALIRLRRLRTYSVSPSQGTCRWMRFGFGFGSPALRHELPQNLWRIVGKVTYEEWDRSPSLRNSRSRKSGRPIPERLESTSSPRNEPVWHERIALAVTARLEADVPLGLFLSGGLDSALIAAIAKQHRPDINAFTVRMPDARMDESEAAAETAAHLGLTHHILDCDAGASKSGPADDLVHLIEQLGLPFGDSSLLPTYWVCRAAREHVTVALSGDGGDELFGGYRRHTINPTLNRWRRFLRLIPDALLDQRRPGSRSTSLARLAVAARHGGYSELLSIFPTPDLCRLMSFVHPNGETTSPGYDDFHPVDDPLRQDFLHYLPDDLLRKTDTASMAVALEVRAPFLARHLVDAALRTPLDVLMPGGQRKGLLKQIARNYLPDHIINRPKQGFAIPIGEWFRTDFGGLRTLLHDHLLAADPFPGLADAGIRINLACIQRLLREHDDAGESSINPWHGRDHSQRLYMLLVLSVWCRWLARLQGEPTRAARSRECDAPTSG